jgi:CubicO group peptidase (beta-lactamase class C family)
MKKRLLILYFSLISCISFSQTVNTDSLDRFITRMMNDFDVPGLAVGIVQNDSVIFLKGYGTRELQKESPVDETTLFGIGSISKSFTVLTLALLAEEGKINWDDKVKDYLPYFELYDPYVTNNFTIRDLLTHRSGLKEVSGGTLWYHSDLSRTEIIKGLKYLDPVSGFREKFAYQNVMYLTASEIVHEVTGITWDAFLKKHVFDPLKMNTSTSESTIREASKNIARPHIVNEVFQNVVVQQEKGDNLAPAGFIYASAKDMCNYIRFWLKDGIFENDTLLKTETVNQIFTPQIHCNFLGEPFNNEFTSYGLGWFLTPKNNHKIIEHSGGIDGMAANLVMVKDMNFGFIILTNVSGPAVMLLTAKILEMGLNDKNYAVYDHFKHWYDSEVQKSKSVTEPEPDYRNTKPSLELSSYAGVYKDEMYGDIFIRLSTHKELTLSFSHTPIFSGTLKHWQYDTFVIDWTDQRIPDGFVTFTFNAAHEIVGFKMEMKHLLDVDFTELEIIKIK